jgi:hypothetical protein
LQQEVAITAVTFKSALKGKKVDSQKTYTLIQVATEHNQQFESLIGKKYSYGSYKNYKTTLKYLHQFVPHHYHKKGFTLNKCRF